MYICVNMAIDMVLETGTKVLSRLEIGTSISSGLVNLIKGMEMGILYGNKNGFGNGIG